MRKSALLWPLLVLAGCSGEAEQADASGQAASDDLASGTELIECAIAGAQGFERTCVVEKAEDEGTTILVVRHPDGGFRRFEVLTDGRGLAVADGAVEAVTEVVDGRLDLSVGSDRYRFPATIKPEDDAAAPVE
jgi:hypothetical protein